MRLAALFSGGKDSTYTIYLAQHAGHDVRFLVTFISENPDSYMFHHPNIWLTKLLGRAMGIPFVAAATKGEKETELEDVEQILRKIGKDVDGVAAGALASAYQYSRVQRMCGRLGLQTFTPSWQRSMDGYWEELLAAGFRIIMTKVACDGLGKEWLGREIDAQAIEELKALSRRHRFHLGGEGGEFETLVVDCPLYKKRLVIEQAKKTWQEDVGVYEISAASLTVK